MQTPVFCRPIDGPISTLALARSAGAGSITLADASRLGTPTPSSPVRLAVVSADGSAVLAQLLATGRSGNVVSAAPIAGLPDLACPAGSVVGCLASAQDVADLQAAVLAAVALINSLNAAIDDLPPPVTSVAGRFGAVTLSTSDVAGLAVVAATGAYGDLSGRPALATVATSGAYSDLTGRPTLGTLAGQNGTFSGTHSGSSSGTNTGDQTDIPGRAGTVATIAGKIAAGSNVTIAGAGTDASPFTISATGGGGGSAAPGGADGAIQYKSGATFAAGTPAIAGDSVVIQPAGNFAVGSAAAYGAAGIAYGGEGTITAGGSLLKLAQSGDQFGQTSLELLNRAGANGARFSCSIWLVDFIFYAIQNGKSSNIRYNTDANVLPENFAKGGEFSFFMDTFAGGGNFTAARIGAGACQFCSPTTFVASTTAGSPLTALATPGQVLPLITLAVPTSIGTARPAGSIDARLAASTDATWRGRIFGSAGDYTGATREGWRVESDGTQPLVGFFGSPAVARPSLTYSRAAEGPAQQQIRLALAALGLVTDSTTP